MKKGEQLSGTVKYISLHWVRYVTCAENKKIRLRKKDVLAVRLANDTTPYDLSEKYIWHDTADLAGLERQKNALWVTFGAAAVALDYERLITHLGKKRKTAFALRGGFGRFIYLGKNHDPNYYLSGNFIFGRGRSHIETGIGAGSLSGELWPVVHMGYRYQNPKKNLVLRIGVSSLELAYWSIGFAFRKAK